MSTITLGIVKNGVIVPNIPLPEGTSVELHVQADPVEITAELQEEFDGWERASAGTIEMVERLAGEMEANENQLTGR